MKLLVTGGTHGMGLGVARALASQGAGAAHQVIITARSHEGGAAAVAEIQRHSQNHDVTFVQGDFSRLSEVKRVVEALHDRHEALDGVYINAGLGYADYRVETVDHLDAHFQVNYLAHFMLTLNVLDLLECSERGGRVVFNVTQGGSIDWSDVQLTRRWNYVKAIRQAMVAKRMFYRRLHMLHRQARKTRISFYGFQIPKTVWSHQINIIPWPMRAMATVNKWLGGFMSIDECGAVIAPLFNEDPPSSWGRSGKLITSSRGAMVELEEDPGVLDESLQAKLWDISLALCHDENTSSIARQLCQGA